MSKHENNGNCPKCNELFEKYPGFDMSMRQWFADVQGVVPEAHISDAGRGRDDQEAYFQRGASKAHFGQSAHNYNAAIDVFEIRNGKATWDKAWYNSKIAPKLNSSLVWYGKPGSKFFELPHIELKGWKEMAQEGALGLVDHIEPTKPTETNRDLANDALACMPKPSIFSTVLTVLSFFRK